jgi:Cu(I)/Ag(I) efflux system periplasmic protein CusF
MRRFVMALAGMAALFTSAPLMPAAAETPTVQGEVKKVDMAQKKLTLKHGPIPNLDMDSMTMVFRVKDAAMLEGLKAGDKITFTADRVNGAITVTSIVK